MYFTTTICLVLLTTQFCMIYYEKYENSHPDIEPNQQNIWSAVSPNEYCPRAGVSQED